MTGGRRTRRGAETLAPLLLFWLALGLLAVPTVRADDTFAPLKKRLIDDGLSQQQVMMAFQPAPSPMFTTISKTLRMRESQLNYNQFLSASNLRKAQGFAMSHGGTLRRAEAQYGVDRNVIVAILLVETQLGSYTGEIPTLAVLATFALMDSKGSRDRVWALLSSSDRKRWDRDAFDQKLLKRADWAYGEVRALLEVSKTQGRRPDLYRGSVMGAIGWPQFLPSSLLKFGVDADGDGRIDLYRPEDAISSVANYLRGYGWSERLSRLEKEEVIHHYNKSRPYVATILEIASRLGASS
jgi:membrane-bound lytic murein transglycosylase B